MEIDVTSTTLNSGDQTLEEALDGQETETPAESSPEDKQEKEAASPGAANTQEESNLPFHKHPRWKEMYEKNKALEARIEELANSQQSQAKAPAQAQDTRPPKSFTELFGDSPEAYQAFKALMDEHGSKASQEAIKAVKEEQRREQEAQKESQKYVDDNLSRLRESGEQFDDNELFDVINKYRPTTADGKSWDFDAGLEILKMLKGNSGKEKVQAKKKLAASTVSHKGSEPETDDVPSIEDIKAQGGWRSYKK